MLEATYKQLLDQYGVQANQADILWNELYTLHNSDNRHYHNLDHLREIHSELLEVKSKIENWKVLLFTLFYHDSIYKATKKNNEEESAKLATKRMEEISIPENEIKLCCAQIIATKSHTVSTDTDTNYFTDADLSILGRDWNTYDNYCKNIRKEYSIYPDLLYTKGRKKVLKHFLSMERIYKTEAFSSKYEQQAIQNLNKELALMK